MLSIVGFALATAFVLYILFGYPLLLGFLARRHACPIRRGAFQPRVSVIVAVHNGEDFLEQKIRSILALDYPSGQMEIIVASDGSTDRTNEIAKTFPQVQLLDLPRAGKPAALNAAITQATGEILIFTDVRQLLATPSLRLLLENFADPAVGAASGELVILKGDTSEETNVGLYWKYELSIRLRLSEIDSIFGATGAYYGLRRELAVPIPADALLDDMHLPLAAFFQGYRLIVDSRVNMYDYPNSLHSEFRRKVRTLAGNYQILRAYPALLGSGNRLWFHFASYKLGRLLLPFAMIVIFFSSWGLPPVPATLMLAGQALFYTLAIADLKIPESAAKKLSSPIRTFVTLMIAALCAGSIFFVPSSKLWKPTRPSRPGK